MEEKNESVIELTSKNFYEKIAEKDKYVLVDFFAPWCGPCRMMAPYFEELSNELQEVSFCKLDTEKYSDIAMKFRVINIPCFILFKNGSAIATKVGGSPKSALKDWIIENTKK